MMFCKLKKTLLSTVLVSAIIVLSTYSIDISKQTAQYGAIAGGTAVGIGTTILINKTLTFLHDFDSKAKPMLISGGAGLATGGVAWYYFYKWLYSLTPEAKKTALDALAFQRTIELYDIVKKAETTVQEIELDPLSNAFSDSDNLIAIVIAKFSSSSWPLVLCKNLFSEHLETLKQIVKKITLVQPEIQQNKQCVDLVQRCEELVARIMVLLSKIQANLVIIIKHDKYEMHVQLYEQVNGTERYFKLRAQENNQQRQHRLTNLRPD